MQAHDQLGPLIRNEPVLSRRIRCHQAWYRFAVLGLDTYGTTAPPRSQPLGSILAEDDARAGRNFLSSASRDLFERRRLDGWGVDYGRCSAHMTSSQAMTFNLFGPLARHPHWLLRAFRKILARDDLARLIDLRLEFGGNANPMGDKTLVDAMLVFQTEAGKPHVCVVEAKLADRFNSRHVPIWLNPRYEAVLDQGLWRADALDLQDRALNQLLRCHAVGVSVLADLAADASPAQLVVVHHPEDRGAVVASRAYGTTLRTRNEQLSLLHPVAVLNQMEAIIGRSPSSPSGPVTSTMPRRQEGLACQASGAATRLKMKFDARAAGTEVRAPVKLSLLEGCRPQEAIPGRQLSGSIRRPLAVMLSTTEIVLTVLGTGAVAGVVTGLFNVLALRLTNKSRSREQLDEREHQAGLRREQAHDEARQKFLPLGERIARYLDHEASEAHWQETGDHFPMSDPGPRCADEKEAVSDLKDISYGHPTKAVRDAAAALGTKIWSAHTEIIDGHIPKPDCDQWVGWGIHADELIELIHAPTPVDRPT